MKQHGLYFAATVCLLIITGVAGYWVFLGIQQKSSPTVCTQEAKQCPDGSYVGRAGPNCEFEPCPSVASCEGGPCPSVVIDPPWRTETSSTTGIIFWYPEQLSTAYIHAVDWPPQAQVITEPFNCINAGSEIMRAGRTEQRTVDNRVYCRTTESEGAAGSIYNNYAYAFQKSNKVVILTFTTRMVQCDNYDDPQKTECKNERVAFHIDSIVDKIAQSAVLK